MNKTNKIILGVGAVALLYFILKPKAKATTRCRGGQVPCGDGSGKCYDPTANYKVNPCGEESAVEDIVPHAPPMPTGALDYDPSIFMGGDRI
jgi:hypothetical protein